MKRFFTFFIMCCLALCSFSQTTREHLKFMGIPIDGSLEHVTKEIMNKGFTFVAKNDKMTCLKGDFAGYNGCSVFISTIVIKDRRTVNAVVVRLPDRYSSALLYVDYIDIKEGLTQKYGAPAYDKYNEPDKYVSYYKVGVAYIAVQMEEKNVVVYYMDKIGKDDNESVSDPMERDL